MNRRARARAIGGAALVLLGSGCAADRGHRAEVASAPLRDVGREIDRLERELDDRGTVAIKQPDVWGQARLTASRVEFEKQMAAERDGFHQALAGQVATSDLASIQSQLALGLAPGAGTGTAAPVPAAPSPSSPAGIGAFGLAQAQAAAPIGLESTVVLDEKKRYLDHLGEIRRVNLGDDTSDSAGYGFYLLRLPASIQPGRATLAGHGATLAVSVRPEFDPGFLPRTFRDLAVNDLVNLLTPVIYSLLTTSGWEEPLAAYELGYTAGWPGLREEERFARVHDLIAELKGKIPAHASGKTLCPISRNDLPRIFLVENLARIARDARPRLGITEGASPAAFGAVVHAFEPTGPGGAPAVRASDLRAYLAGEIRHAYDLMAEPARPGIGLDDVGRIATLDAALAGRAFEGYPGQAPDHVVPGSPEHNGLAQLYPELIATLPGNLKQRSMGALCWAVAVEAALLDRRVREEVRRMNASGRLACAEVEALRFHRPAPDPASASAFEGYVRARWPAVAFALDPVVDEQNVADSRRLARELQLASAFALASGQVNGSHLGSYLRQASRASDSVRLNRTVTAFVHGNESFGWRFAPRFQERAAPAGPLRALGQSAAGSLGHDPESLARLEPGIRELTAVVLLPSFLPAVRLEVSGDWYPLDDPGRAVFESGWVLEEGRGVMAARQGLASACDSGAYRPVDVAGLSARLDRLEARLPLQSYKADVPYENGMGGFELFTPGSMALRPELTGYEGAARVDPRGGEVIFLLARNVDLGTTRVVVGGRPVDPEGVEILSREVIRLTLPPCERPGPGRSGPVIDVQIATPNGVSNRLAIPCLTPVLVGPPVELAEPVLPTPPDGPGPFAKPGTTRPAPATATPSSTGPAGKKDPEKSP